MKRPLWLTGDQASRLLTIVEVSDEHHALDEDGEIEAALIDFVYPAEDDELRPTRDIYDVMGPERATRRYGPVV